MSPFYPVQLLADWLTYSVFGIAEGTLLGSAVNFFIFDTIKIFLLLAVIVFLVAVVRSFLPPARMKLLLSSRRKYAGNGLAAVLGIFTPFCTCSAVPLFIGFLQAGVPLGVTFSFLVASPMINEVALVLLLGLFGWKIALIYIFSGLVIAILSGIIIGKMNLEDALEEFVKKNRSNGQYQLSNMTWRQRITGARDYTGEIIMKVWPYIIVGIGIGAWIHGYVPTDFLARYASSEHWYAVPLAVLVGIPLYSNAAGVIPLVGALTEKGVAVGTSLAFMMAVTALSLPEFMILKKVMRTKLIMIFAAIVGLGIMFTGYLFNYILR